MQHHTPKHFVLQLGALLSLYVSLGALLVLLFSLINIMFPDAADSAWVTESARDAVRGAIATLLVVFPSYLVLTRVTNQARRHETGGTYTALARWLIYLSLLVGGGVIAADLVTLIVFFLHGELTVRFVLKVLVLLFVVGATVTYYVLDIRGYFIERARRSLVCGAVASALVLATIVIGFLNIDTPAEVREARIDEQQLDDLREIQWRVEDYLRVNEAVPTSLSEVYDVEATPSAPPERSVYRYEVTADGFQLCAEFARSSTDSSFSQVRPLAPDRDLQYPYILNPNSWEHEAGDWCFERTIIDTN